MRLDTVVLGQGRAIARMLQRLPRQIGKGLTAPLTHAQMGMLADQEQVRGDGSPHHVQAVEVDQGRLHELRDRKQRWLPICRGQIHAFARQLTKRLDQMIDGVLAQVTRGLKKPGDHV